LRSGCASASGAASNILRQIVWLTSCYSLVQEVSMLRACGRIVSGLALVLWGLGCSEPKDDTTGKQANETEQTAADPTAGLVDDPPDGSFRPAGTYLGALSGFNWLSLAADGSYWWETDVDSSSGTYRFQKQGDNHFLVLDESSDGSYLQLYGYAAIAGGVQLIDAGDSTGSTAQTLLHTGDLQEPCSLDADGVLACNGTAYCTANDPEWDGSVSDAVCQPGPSPASSP
jgi:hypothetical protein